MFAVFLTTMRAFHAHGMRQVIPVGVAIPNDVAPFPLVQSPAMRTRHLVMPLVAKPELFGNAAFAINARRGVPESLFSRKVGRSSLDELARVALAATVFFPLRNFIAEHDSEWCRALS